MPIAGDALVTGMGLKPQQIKLLIRVGWVLGVSFHMAWVCGWLVAFGLASPFARAGDVEQLQKAARVSARLNLQTELRIQIRVWCTHGDDEVKRAAYGNIQRLRIDLEDIAGVKEPEPSCPTTTISSARN